MITLKDDSQHVNFGDSEVYGNTSLTLEDDTVVRCYFKGEIDYSKEGYVGDVTLYEMQVVYRPDYRYERYPANDAEYRSIERKLKDRLAKLAWENKKKELSA